MNYIIIKSGILKAYDFSEEFINKNNDVFNQFVNIWDELYSGSCCVWGACEKNKDNNTIKQKIVDILEKMYNLGIQIENGFTDEVYNNFEDVKDYILNYGM